MSERRNFVLHSERIRDNAIAAIDAAGPGWTVTIAPPKRSTDQNSMMWAMLADVAKAKPNGRQWTTDTWKAAFMHHLGHQVQFAEGLDGSGPFPVGFRTSHLTIAQMGDLITCIQAYCAENDIPLTETVKGGFFDVPARDEAA